MGQPQRTLEKEERTEAGVFWDPLQQQMHGYCDVHLSIMDELDTPAVEKAGWKASVKGK